MAAILSHHQCVKAFDFMWVHSCFYIDVDICYDCVQSSHCLNRLNIDLDNVGPLTKPVMIYQQLYHHQQFLQILVAKKVFSIKLITIYRRYFVTVHYCDASWALWHLGLPTILFLFKSSALLALCKGNHPVTDGFSPQRAINAMTPSWSDEVNLYHCCFTYSHRVIRIDVESPERWEELEGIFSNLTQEVSIFLSQKMRVLWWRRVNLS